MDMLSRRLESLHHANTHEQASGLAPKPLSPPKLFELHDIDHDFPSVKPTVDRREMSRRAAMTAVPSLSAARAASVGQEEAQVSNQSTATKRLDAESILDTAQTGDADGVSQHLAAERKPDDALKEAAIRYLAEVVGPLPDTANEGVRFQALIDLLKHTPPDDKLDVATEAGCLIYRGAKDVAELRAHLDTLIPAWMGCANFNRSVPRPNLALLDRIEARIFG